MPRSEVQRAVADVLVKEFGRADHYSLKIANALWDKGLLVESGEQKTNVAKEALIENLEAQMRRGIIDHYTATSIRELIGYVRSGD